ncbi:MAG: DNA-binding transcriptional LysR family regulator [Reinekea sp.]|jgi:DNA-binding transcriptional LysR family regulator
MRYLSSDLNLFRVLLTIYLQGNLTRAGKVLGVTQPAISNALARLRTMYDDPLFVRSGSRMRPTQKTEQIIQQVSIALELLTSTLIPDQPMPQPKD